MGWCSATEIFDCAAEGWLEAIKLYPNANEMNPEFEKFLIQAKTALKNIIQKLENDDWDCQSDSAYFSHPFIHEIFVELDDRWKDET